MGAVLRTRVTLDQVPLGRGSSVNQCLMGLIRGPARDEAQLLLGLATKTPLLTDLGADVVDRFRGCEARDMDRADGEPLVLCAHLDGVAAGVPSSDAWDRETLTVRFDEILPNEEIQEVSETIDHVARLDHAHGIVARHLRHIRSSLNPRSLWDERDRAFPDLVFGPDVREQLARASTRTFSSMKRRLAELDEAAREWRRAGGSAPRWKSEVTRESDSVRKNPRLWNARRFRSVRGGRAWFEWHARFGGGGRIHLRFTSSRLEVEVGYIGPHLPL